MQTRFTLTTSFILIVMLLLSFNSHGQGSESFIDLNASETQFESGFFTGNNGIEWSYSQVRRVTDIQYYITEPSAGFSASETEDSYIEATISGGIDTLEYNIRSYLTEGDQTHRTIRVLINGNEIDSLTLSEMDTVYSRTIDSISVGGEFTLRFESIGTEPLLIDDIEWTGYAEPAYAITIADVVNGTANVSTDPANEAQEYETVTVNIFDIETGMEFSSIEVTGDVSNEIITTTTIIEGEEYTFEMPSEAVTVTVVLDSVDYELVVNTEPVGWGGVFIDPDQVYYNYRDEVTLVATPNEGYEFISWSGDTTNINNAFSDTVTLIMPDSSVTLTANL